MLDRRSFTLCEGSTVIGREDRRSPSDLQICDPEVSRRSVRIEVTPDGSGSYVFTLIVMKALTPVKVNGSVIAEGKNVRLNSGDLIVMGRTTLNFRTFGKSGNQGVLPSE